MASRQGSQIRPPSKQPSVPKKPADKKEEKTDKPKKSKKEEKLEFQLPALSVVGKKKEIDYEAIRKKVTRRGNPEGEDKKQLASILKHLKESQAKIRVHEFVNLVSKYTCDNGETMRHVLEEDLAYFRKMVTKVYENMTQDVSDVLINEQIQAQAFYQERYDILNNKMLKMISEIFQMIPQFDFGKYAEEKESFLKYICPIPVKLRRDEEDMDLQRRQEAFHRLRWLKIEEDRLRDENKRLLGRLDELRGQHQRETTTATMKNQIMENKLRALEEQQEEKQEHLNELEDLLGKNIVRTEAYIRLEGDEKSRIAPPPPKETVTARQHRQKKIDWSTRTARSIEASNAKKLVDAEVARADEKKRMRRQQRDPKSTSLFGGSHAKNFPEVSLRRTEDKKIQKTRIVTEEKRPGKGRCAGGCP